MRDVVGALVLTFAWLIAGSILGLSMGFILAGMVLTGILVGTLLEITGR